jgi:hypothetical protein
VNNPFTRSVETWVSPSLNRIRLVELPGGLLPPEIKGRLAYELLSRPALEALIRQRATDLRLHSNEPNLPLSFDRCFTVSSPMVRDSAQGIACEYGRRLGYLLLTLKRGDLVNRMARPEWQAHHWAYWHAVDHIWVGGGLVSGHLGPVAIRQAQEVLARAGVPHFQVRLVPNAMALPLLGAARYASPEAQVALLFDFGQTLVKRALAIYEQGCVTDLILLASIDSPCQTFLTNDTSPSVIEKQVDAMLQLMSQSWDEVRLMGEEPDKVMLASLACHMFQGQPYPSEMGCYGRIQLLTPNLPKYLSASLSQRLRLPVEIRLVQDGTAAATAVAGRSGTAVLVLGTAIGIGFPPPVDGLRSLGPKFECLG